MRKGFLSLAAALALTAAAIAANDPKELYSSGLELQNEGDLEAADKLFRRACDQNFAAACYEAAQYMLLDEEDGGLNPLYKDYDRAEKLLDKSCAANYAKACNSLGEFYKEADDYKAMKLYKKSCDLGDMIGCGELARYYSQSGEGAVTDGKKAVELFSKSCDHNIAFACEELGELYENGIFVKKDMEKAKTLLKKAQKLNEENGD